MEHSLSITLSILLVDVIIAAVYLNIPLAMKIHPFHNQKDRDFFSNLFSSFNGLWIIYLLNIKTELVSSYCLLFCSSQNNNNAKTIMPFIIASLTPPSLLCRFRRFYVCSSFCSMTLVSRNLHLNVFLSFSKSQTYSLIFGFLHLD